MYLPSGTEWIDFWTGERHRGGKSIQKKSDINTIPLYVRSGSIIPLGPDVQYATEKPWDDLEIRIYPGADGKFSLYEDEFDNYNYEKGMYSTITFSWDDSKHILTISDRKGEYPGMLNDRRFRIKVIDPAGQAKDVSYSGKSTIVKL